MKWRIKNLAELFLFSFVLIGCGVRECDESSKNVEQVEYVEHSPFVTRPPGALPDPDDLPNVENSLVGKTLTVNCAELKSSIFEIAKMDSETIVITKISEVPEDDHYGLYPIMTTVYVSKDVVNMNEMPTVLVKGIECTVSEQRYIHAEVWSYFHIAFSSLKEKYALTEKLSDSVCYGHLTDDEELILNENLFFDCDASRTGISYVFQKICNHYDIGNH